MDMMPVLFADITHSLACAACNMQFESYIHTILHLQNRFDKSRKHYDDVIMDSIASQITCLMIIYSTVHSGTGQRKHQSSASLAFVWEIQRWPVNFPHKWPVTQKMFPFDEVIMKIPKCLFGTIVPEPREAKIYLCNIWKMDKFTNSELYYLIPEDKVSRCEKISKKGVILDNPSKW